MANGVGMGIAERWLRTHFSPEVCDHHTFVIAGDGCFEEGISHEAASLAGHLQLGRLVYIYDDNHITIDGPTELSYSDNVGERFAAYGWAVDDIGEVANDLDALEAALLRAKAEEDRPSLIILRSHIGYPSPHLTDTAKAHGDPFPRGGDPPDQGAARPPARRDASGCPTTSSTSTGRASPGARPAGPSGSERFDGLGRRQGPLGGRPSAATACPGGSRSCPPSPPRTGPWPPARPSRPASTPPATPSPGSCPAAPT